MLKTANLPGETLTFIGSKDTWKGEIEEVMSGLKNLEDDLPRREVFSSFPSCFVDSFLI